MARARHEFEVQKVGDTYITVPVDHHPNATRTTFGIWGVVLVLMGFSAKGWRSRKTSDESVRIAVRRMLNYPGAQEFVL